jgi:putative ABC transport system ATP-binding protein
MTPLNPDAAAAVRVSRVSYFFGAGDSRNQVLFDNSISIGSGELVILTGPSGSGKTTLLTLIGALRSVQEGAISLYGKDLGGLPGAGLVEVRRGIGFIFQMHNLFESLTAYENVKMGMQVAGIPRDKMRACGVDMLQRLGLGHRTDYKPGALSGGQRQRVAIARALVHRPGLVLADEPTAALDKESGRNVVELLKELAHQNGSAILMVTHDNRVIESADRIINMVDGRIVSDVVLNETLQICEYLRNSSVFQHMSPHEISNVAGKVFKRQCDAGTVIVKQGDMGDEFFLIAKGNARVEIDGSTAAALGAGEFFGEASLISGAPRNATVTATTPMLLYVLEKADFRSALDANESFKEQIFKVIFQRQ